MTKNETAVPTGYKSVTGNLPPFVSLSIGDTLHGQIFRVRTTNKKEKVKSGKTFVEVEKIKLYFDLTLVEPGTYNAGTIKKPDNRDFERGSQVTLSGSGDITFAFKKELFEAMGLVGDAYPKEGEAFPELEWPKLYGRKVWIRREKDGTVKKGDFKGNRKNQYTIAFSPAEVPASA